MKVHIPKKQLAEGLSHVERVIPTRSSNPGLSLLKLELSGGQLIFCGSNLDMDIRAELDTEIEAQESYAVPAHVFAQVVKFLPGEVVELEFGAKELEISSGTYTTKLQLDEVSSTPEFSFPQSYAGQLDGQRLAKALSNVRYAAAVAEYQAIFRGVKLEFNDKSTRAVATDGFRLAYYDIEEASGLEADIVIPARSVDEMIKLLEAGTAELELSDSQLSLKSGPYALNLKLMEGAFPDYERVIPSAFGVNITVGAKALSEAVTRVALMADKTSNNRVDLFIKEGVLQITSEGSFGRSQEALEVMQEGEESEIALAYNAQYLVDALRPLEGEMRFSFSGTTSPSLVVGINEPSYLAMVVPLRTN